MNSYQGTLRYRLSREGSRSEGYYAFLVTDDGAEIPLCREGVPPFNDPRFAPFDGRQVRIEGSGSHGWIIVEHLEAAGPDTRPSDENGPEPDEMPEISENDEPNQIEQS